MSRIILIISLLASSAFGLDAKHARILTHRNQVKMIFQDIKDATERGDCSTSVNKFMIDKHTNALLKHLGFKLNINEKYSNMVGISWCE